MIRDLTVHEAMPGHYLQLAHANEFRAPTLVRAIFENGPFIEGWAVYCEQMMAEKGYGGPDVKMQQLKMRLRVDCNAILDQSIHAGNMTEKEAMDLMMKEGYQQEGEAVAKWKRAQLTSAQLSTYFVGVSEMLEIRDLAKKKARRISKERLSRQCSELRQPAAEIRSRVARVVVVAGIVDAGFLVIFVRDHRFRLQTILDEKSGSRDNFGRFRRGYSSVGRASRSQ